MPNHTVPFPASIERVAYHEAGHCVVTYKLTGPIPDSISLKQDSSGHWEGDNQPDPTPKFTIPVDYDCKAHPFPSSTDGWAGIIAGLLGGRNAVAKALNLGVLSLPSGSFENYPGEAGFIAPPGAFSTVDDCSNVNTYSEMAVTKKYFRTRAEAIIRADALSRSTVAENWDTIEKIASGLVSKQNLTRDELEALL